MVTKDSDCGGYTLEDQVGLRPGRPIDNWPQEGDYSAWAGLEKKHFFVNSEILRIQSLRKNA